MDKAKIKATPNETSPATERVRSSAHVSPIWERKGRLTFDVALALDVRFLRFAALPASLVGASLSLRRMFFAMDTTNLNALETWELWAKKASSRGGVQKALFQLREFAIFAVPILETMAKKGNRVQVILECTEHKESGMPGTSRYVTTKNRKNTPDRMEIKKFNPVLRKYTVHKEIKYEDLNL